MRNDGQSPNGIPDGIEQPGYPMSRAYVFQGATRLEANSEGLVTVTGEYQTSLTGPFIRIQDSCGAVNEATSCDTLDLATSPGTDCARRANHSSGDTHSARTGFYELNRLIDQAKSWIGPGATANPPVAGWMNRQFPANMNINNACNAFFSPIDPCPSPHRIDQLLSQRQPRLERLPQHRRDRRRVRPRVGARPGQLRRQPRA